MANNKKRNRNKKKNNDNSNIKDKSMIQINEPINIIENHMINKIKSYKDRESINTMENYMRNKFKSYEDRETISVDFLSYTLFNENKINDNNSKILFSTTNICKSYSNRKLIYKLRIIPNENEIKKLILEKNLIMNASSNTYNNSKHKKVYVEKKSVEINIEQIECLEIYANMESCEMPNIYFKNLKHLLFDCLNFDDYESFILKHKNTLETLKYINSYSLISQNIIEQLTKLNHLIFIFDVYKPIKYENICEIIKNMKIEKLTIHMDLCYKYEMDIEDEDEEDEEDEFVVTSTKEFIKILNSILNCIINNKYLKYVLITDISENILLKCDQKLIDDLKNHSTIKIFKIGEKEIYPKELVDIHNSCFSDIEIIN